MRQVKSGIISTEQAFAKAQSVAYYRLLAALGQLLPHLRAANPKNRFKVPLVPRILRSPETLAQRLVLWPSPKR